MGREGGLKLRWARHQRLTCACGNCGKMFFVPPARKETAKFCSNACKNAVQRSAVRRLIMCERCGQSFETKQDHGVWPRFCSNACRTAGAIIPAPKECAACGAMFVADRSSHESPDGLRKYCSRKCAHDGLKNGQEVYCKNCSKPFYVAASLAQQGCCSQTCATAFYVEGNSRKWKGGEYVDTTSGQIRTRVDGSKKGGSAYLGEHRVIAAQYVGRLLHSSEQILHINGNPADNRPDNLFICRTMSERQRRRMGSLPFPTKTNLRTYK